MTAHSSAIGGATQTPPAPLRNTSVALQAALWLDIALRLLVWTIALAFTLCAAGRAEIVARWSQLDLRQIGDALKLARELGAGVLLFNVYYLLTLVVLRLPIPRPRHGKRPLPTWAFDRDLLCVAALGALTRARYQPMFPAFLVPQLAGVQPFRWLLGLQFGPSTRSSFWGEPMILDPTEVRIGRNVGIGYGTTIAGHLLTRGEIQFAPTLIEDDVQIGGHSVIPGGVTLRRGSVIGIHSYVKPGTVVGENEFWAGVPARFIKSVTPHGDPGPPAGSGSV